MSGILGAWNLDGRPIEPGLLSQLAANMAHRGRDGDGVSADGCVGLACRLSRVTPEARFEAQPLVHASGTVVVFDGRLDNRHELMGLLAHRAEASTDDPDPNLVAAAYDAFGDEFATFLQGDFAVGLFDPRRRCFVLARDALGVRPLYYYWVPDLFLFASEIKAILAHPRVATRPNDDALAEFLVGGLGGREAGEATFFNRVCRILPAHTLIVTPEGMVSRRYWDFDPARQLRFGSFEQYTEAFRHHFSEAVRRRLRASRPVAVSVSGGLDSSAIFCAAETLRRRDPKSFPDLRGVSYTFADLTPPDEKAYLTAIERAYGVVIERVPSGPPGLLNDCGRAVWHVEAPLLDAQWNTQQALLAAVEQRGARVLLTGHWGDQFLFDREYLVDLVASSAWSTVGAHLREYARWCKDVPRQVFVRHFLRSLLGRYLPERMRARARHVRGRLRRLSQPKWYTPAFRRLADRRNPFVDSTPRGSFATAHAQSLYREARSDYHVLCMEWNNKVAAMHGLEMAFPFLDRDLIAFLMAIPGDAQHWKGVPKAILREAVRGVVPDAIVDRRGKADFTDHVNEGLARHYSVFTDLLSDALSTRLGYTDAALLSHELSRVKDRIRGPTNLVSWKLADLIGLELWLRAFFDAPGKGTEDMLYGRPA